MMIRKELRSKDLTVCVAGIAEKKKRIIAVFDRRLSSGGGIDSSDGAAWKMTSVGNQWWVLLAGAVSEMTAISDAVKSAMKKTSKMNVRQVARLCSDAFREERCRLIETEILTEYDVDSFDEYRGMKNTDRDLYEAIGAKIKDWDTNLNLLMCGFTHDKNPHIFVVSGPGKIQYCDIQGHAVIGSGSYAAHFSLNRYPYDKWKPFGDCMYSCLAAKFAAESADGVGPDTAVFVLGGGRLPLAKKGDGVVFATDAIEEVKQKWKALPRIPDGVALNLEQNYDGFISMKEVAKRHQQFRKNLRTRQLASRSSKGQP